MSDKEFLQEMAKKCEVSTFKQVYLKILSNNQGLIKCNDIFPNNPKYNLEKIQTDVENIDTLLILRIFDIFPHKKNSPLSNSIFKKEFYLVARYGLKKIIDLYRNEKIIKKKIDWNDMIALLGVKEEDEVKFASLIKKMVANQEIQAKLVLKPKKYLYFFSFLERKENQKKILQLVSLLIVFAFLLIFLLRITKGFL